MSDIDALHWLWRWSEWILALLILWTVVSTAVCWRWLHKRKRDEEAVRAAQREWWQQRIAESGQRIQRVADYPLIVETLPNGRRKVISYLGDSGEVRRFPPPAGFEGLD